MFLSETIVGLRTIKIAVEGCEGVNKSSSNTGLVKVANNLYRMYMEHLRQEKSKKRQTRGEKWKQEACKRKVDEIRPEKIVWKIRASKGQANSITEGYGESCELC